MGAGSAAVLAVAADDEEDLLFHIAVVAGNRSARGAGRIFRIDLVEVEGLDEPITRAVETGASPKSVDDLLGESEGRKRAAPKRDSAREIILRELALEPQQLDYLKAKGAAEGISGDTMWQAANELKSELLIDRGNSGPGTPWLWFLTSGPRARAREEPPEPEHTDFGPKTLTSGSRTSPELSPKSGDSPVQADLNGAAREQLGIPEIEDAG